MAHGPWPAHGPSLRRQASGAPAAAAASVRARRAPCTGPAPHMAQGAPPGGPMPKQAPHPIARPAGAPAPHPAPHGPGAMARPDAPFGGPGAPMAYSAPSGAPWHRRPNGLQAPPARPARRPIRRPMARRPNGLQHPIRRPMAPAPQWPTSPPRMCPPGGARRPMAQRPAAHVPRPGDPPRPRMQLLMITVQNASFVHCSECFICRETAWRCMAIVLPTLPWLHTALPWRGQAISKVYGPAPMV